MKNVIVASFKDESKAIEALHKLNELESFGDISIYEQIMVRKNADGKTEILKQEDGDGWRTLAGMGVGSLLGMLGGPVGFVIGLYTGTAIGAITDIRHYDFAKDFVAKVEKKIAIGTVAIIAEIEEDSAVFIDIYLQPMGAKITRSDVDLEFDNYVDEQIEQIETEMAEERAVLKKAMGNEKKIIQSKIALLREKRRTQIAEFIAKRNEVEENIKSDTIHGVAKVKADLESIGNRISNEVKSEKLARVKRRISKHENILNELNSELNEIQS